MVILLLFLPAVNLFHPFAKKKVRFLARWAGELSSFSPQKAVAKQGRLAYNKRGRISVSLYIP